MKSSYRPTEYEFWFVRNIRGSGSQKKLNPRQLRILEKVRKWEKSHGHIDQKEWKF